MLRLKPAVPSATELLVTSAGLGRARLLLPLPEPARVSSTSTGACCRDPVLVPGPMGSEDAALVALPWCVPGGMGPVPLWATMGRGAAGACPSRTPAQNPCIYSPSCRPLETARWDNN